MNMFGSEMAAEIERIDALYQESSTVQGHAANALVLEYPGLAIVASRSPAARRPVLASIIKKALTATDEAAKKSVIVFANATKQLLMRELIAVASDVAFAILDNATLVDEDWPKLVQGVSRLSEWAGAEEQPNESDDAGRLKARSRIQWSDNPVAVADVLRALSECEAGSTVIIENAHLLRGADLVSAALSDLRNCAAATGNFLYLGIGLSHWPDVRKSNNRKLLLTDLPEAYADTVNIADKISLLAPSFEGAEVTIFDPRYVDALHDPLEF
jgi:hypothetical protein